MRKIKKMFLPAIAVVIAGTMTVTPVFAAPATVAQTPSTTQPTPAETEMTRITKQYSNSIRSLFNAEYYAARYPDVAKAYGNDAEALFQHFINVGIKEGRQPGATFNVNAYSSCYKDIALTFGKDLVGMYIHYLQLGINEGRTLTTVEAANAKGIEVKSALTNKPVHENGYTFRKVEVSSSSSSDETTEETNTDKKEDKKEKKTKEPVYTYKWLPIRWEGHHDWLLGVHYRQLYIDGVMYIGGDNYEDEDISGVCEFVNGECPVCGCKVTAVTNYDGIRILDDNGKLIINAYGLPIYDKDGNEYDYVDYNNGYYRVIEGSEEVIYNQEGTEISRTSISSQEDENLNNNEEPSTNEEGNVDEDLNDTDITPQPSPINNPNEENLTDTNSSDENQNPSDDNDNIDSNEENSNDNAEETV